VTAAEYYRSLAADAEAQARLQTIPAFQREWQGVAQSYRRLADKAEDDARADAFQERDSAGTGSNKI
jgi:hypothetical protein